MIKHNIFSLLKTFTPAEIERFGDFVNSPYFNQRKKPAILYREIIKSYPLFNNTNFARKSLYKKIFNLPVYKDSSLRNLFANLLNLAEEFISIENFRKGKLNSSNYLLEELIIRDQPSLIIKKVKKIESDLVESGKIDFNYLLSRCQFERNLFNFRTMHEKIVSKRKIYPQIETLNIFGIYLTAYFTIEIITQYLNVIVYAEKFNTNGIPGLINEIIESFNIKRIYEAIKGKNECDIVLELYLALHRAFSDFEIINNYHEYKSLVGKYHTLLSNEELYFHYFAMISYCIIKAKEPEFKDIFREELLMLYKEELENEYYKNRKTNFLPETLFRDILFLSIRLKKHELLKRLVTEFSLKLSPEERPNMFNFASSFYNYEKGNLGASLKYLNNIKLDYFIYKYDVKNLTMRIYYDLNYYEEVLSLIHSYRELLRKDEFLSNNRKLRHRNFIGILGRMTLIKGKNSDDDPGFLKKKILSSNVSYKNWLLERINELIESNK